MEKKIVKRNRIIEMNNKHFVAECTQRILLEKLQTKPDKSRRAVYTTHAMFAFAN